MLEQQSKELVLSIDFNSLPIKGGVIVKNPLVIPKDGSIFSCDWRLYYDSYGYNKRDEDLRLIEDFENEACFICRVWQFEFEGSRTVVHVTLFSEGDYKECYLKTHTW